MSATINFHPECDPQMIAQSPDCCLVDYDEVLGQVNLAIFLNTKGQALALAAAAAAAAAWLPETRQLRSHG
jgi:hypothetical protein